MRIVSNISSLTTLNQLTKNNKDSASVQKKLSSGLRIQSAADDAAGLAISEKMRGQIRGLAQAERNIQDGVSLIQTAEGALADIHDMLQRSRELAVQAANDSLTDTDRNNIQKEMEQLNKGIDDIAYGTNYNGIKPLLPADLPVRQAGNSNKADIVFFLDNSGSMYSVINTVKTGISNFVSNVNNTLDARIAFVNITSPGDVTPLEGDPASVADNLNSIMAGGLTSPVKDMESAVSGSISSTLGYRDDAKKVFVLFTDTNNETGTGNSTNLAALLEGANVQAGYDSDDIQTYVFGFTTFNGNFPNSIYPANYKTFVEETGGKLYTPSSSSDITNALLNDLVEDIGNNIGPAEDEIHLQPKKLSLQVGANHSHIYQIKLTDARTVNLGIDDISVDSRNKAEQAITKLDNAIKHVSSERSRFGAYLNALEHINSNDAASELNLTMAESQIRDADMEKEAVKSTKENILQQSALAMLAQANQQPQGVLRLLQ